MSASLPGGSLTVDELDALRGEDESRAREALSRLWGGTRPYVLRQLARKGVRGDDAEDVCQAAFSEIWRRRGTVRAMGTADWYALVRRRVAWEMSDRAGLREREERARDETDVPREDLPYLEALIEVAEAARGLYDLADRLWLGEPLARDARVGAAVAQLVLVDGVAPEHAARAFGATEEDAERWIADPAVLARALFAALCWPGDDLAAFVLRPDRPLSRAELDAVHAGEAVPTAWEPHEARLVALRLRNGLLEAELRRLSGDVVSAEGLVQLLGRVRAALPFRALADALVRSLEPRGRSRALAEPDLWKRIVFEYAVRHELPHRQIAERAGPPAERSRYRVDEAKLNNWLSLGRLFSQLGAFAEGETA